MPRRTVVTLANYTPQKMTLKDVPLMCSLLEKLANVPTIIWTFLNPSMFKSCTVALMAGELTGSGLSLEVLPTSSVILTPSWTMQVLGLDTATDDFCI